MRHLAMRAITAPLFLAIAAGSSVGAAPPAVSPPELEPPAEQQSLADLPQTMFGFEVGEQRRYVLGPPDALVEGESMVWNMRLVDVTMSDSKLFAVFDLRFQATAFTSLDMGLRGRNVKATLVVNEAGFPGVLTVQEQHNEVILAASYSVQENETYQLVSTWPNEEIEFVIPFASHRDLDLEAQTGLGLFSNGRDLRGRLVKRSLETIFANPGLLTLSLPWPPTTGWRQERLMFTPGGQLPRFPSGGLRLNQDRAAARVANFTRMTLGIGELEQVDIGGYDVEAYELRLTGPYRRAYVDPLGRVLLLEHEPNDGRRPRHIRMLWPWEY